MYAAPATRMISKAARFVALAFVLLALLALAIVSIAQIYEAIFTVLLSSKHFKSAVLTGTLLAALIPAGYIVANTFALCGIAVRRCCAFTKQSRQ